jgi:hypothetical protein
MITTQPRKVEKEFDSIYKSEAMKLHLQEEGWDYICERGDKVIYRLIY